MTFEEWWDAWLEPIVNTTPKQEQDEAKEILRDAWLASRNAALDEAANVCVEKGKHWQSMAPNIISPVACAATDCADAILALKDRSQIENDRSQGENK